MMLAPFPLWKRRPYRLVVRTAAFQAVNSGSIPDRVMTNMVRNDPTDRKGSGNLHGFPWRKAASQASVGKPWVSKAVWVMKFFRDGTETSAWPSPHRVTRRVLQYLWLRYIITNLHIHEFRTT